MPNRRVRADFRLKAEATSQAAEARRRARRRGIACGYLLLTSMAPLAAEQLPVKTYTMASGLAHDNVMRIVADSRGFLWFCTLDGLSRFDGYRFTTYTTKDGLPSSYVNDIVESRAGIYWIATATAGISRFDPAGGRDARFKTFRLGDGSYANSEVNALLEDRFGYIWAGTAGNLFRLDPRTPDGGFERIDLGIALNRPADILDLLQDNDGNLWIATANDLLRRTPEGRVEGYRLQPDRPMDYIWALEKDDRGRIWVGHQFGLLVFDPTNAAPPVIRTTNRHPSLVTRHSSLVTRLFTTRDGLPHDDVRAVHHAADGRIWIGTRSGPAVFDGERFRHFASTKGLQSPVMTITEDQAGNLWLGVQAAGAIRISTQGLLSYGVADGLGTPSVTSIFETASGDLIAIGPQWTISRLEGGRFRSFRPNLPRRLLDASPLRWEILQDHLEEWWVATEHGLYRFPRVDRLDDLSRVSPKAVYSTRDGLADNYISRLFEDSRGDIWISSFHPPEMLTRWDRAANTFHRYSAKDGLPADNWANTFAKDRSGAVWMGLHNGGLARYAGGRFEVFGPSEEIPSGLMQGLFVDRKGRLWIATRGGNGRIDDPGAHQPAARSVARPEQLSSDNLRCFTEDLWGHIYIGTARGVDKLDPDTGHSRHFTAADGLPASEVLAAYRDRHGNLWFGTRQGLSRLTPRQDAARTPPPVLISSVRVAGVPHPVSELGDREISGLRLEARQNPIEIGFLAVNFSSDESLKYQYKIEGSQGDWSEPGDQRTIAASVAPGQYRVLVRSVRDGVPSDRPAVVSFVVLPPIWQRWWFMSLLAAIVGAAVAAGHRYRLRQALEVERVRMRIATDLHDDIGSSLSQIAILSEVARQQIDTDASAAKPPLSQIATTSRELVDAMSDIVWAINPRRDQLDDLSQRMRRFASDSFTARDIQFCFNGPGAGQRLKVGADVRRQMFLIFKEAVNNVVRHSDCTAAEVTFTRDRDRLVLTVRDNGRGFDQHQVSQGHGLASMAGRANAMGGRLEVISAPGVDGRGTRLTLTVPLSRPRASWRSSA